ncbi:MAG TPA: hypothetical protein DIU07_19835 [Rhodobacteraceae bacterium]|nr:hypothetical protein [Paracoccaceae bacterium]
MSIVERVRFLSGMNSRAHVTRIADAACVSKSTLYAHFPPRQPI